MGNMQQNIANDDPFQNLLRLNAANAAQNNLGMMGNHGMMNPMGGFQPNSIGMQPNPQNAQQVAMMQQQMMMMQQRMQQMSLQGGANAPNVQMSMQQMQEQMNNMMRMMQQMMM